MILKNLKIKNILDLTGVILGRENIWMVKKYKILYYDYDISRIDAVYYLQLNCLRNIAICPILIWVQSVELLQFFVFLVGCVIMTIFILKNKPFKTKVDYRVSVVNEILLLCMLGFEVAFYELNRQGVNVNALAICGFVYMGVFAALVLAEGIKAVIEIAKAFLSLGDHNKIKKQRIHPVTAKGI
jgi:hypothetical protein